MNVAVLGLGFMGATHVKAWRAIEDAALAGVMSSDPAKLSGDLTMVRGNLGSTGERVDFGSARRFQNLESVLADSLIDTVDICLPTDLHAQVAVAALRAGKHVLLEKPIALDRDTADAVCEEGERSGRILMVAQVLRFIPAYRRLAAWIQGRKADSAFFNRQCGKPAWLADISKSGGAVLDLLIHDLDFCISLWGMPAAVSATFVGTHEDRARAALIYPDREPVIVQGGWHSSPEYPFSMDYSVTSGPETRIWSSTDPQTDSDAADPFVEELRYFAACVNSGKAPDFCPPRQSAQSVALAQFILESRNAHGKLVKTS